MEIIGIGTDIENIQRFIKKPFEKNKAFYEKIFTKKEILYCIKKANTSQHFAARFCAKEATIKAIDKPLNFKDIEIIKDKEKPKIKIKNCKNKIFLSLSHTKDSAIAFVIII